MKGNCCWTSGLTAKLLIPLDAADELVADILEAADRFEAELVIVIAAAFNADVEEEAEKEE